MVAEFRRRRHSVAACFSSKESHSEGEKLYKEATRKKLSYQGCRVFRLCSRDRIDFDRTEAAKKYHLAAQHFMNSGQWDKAGECYENCAKLQELGRDIENVDAAANYTNASLCYKQDELGRSRRDSIGNRKSARNKSASLPIASEVKLPNINDEKLKPINSSLSRLAHLQMDSKRYEKARENFETVATNIINSGKNLEQAVDFLFKACMCELMFNPPSASLRIIEYYKLYPPCQESSQFKFFSNLLEVVQRENQQEFQQLLNENEQLCLWIQKMLEEISKCLGFEDSIRKNISSERKRRLSGTESQRDPFYALYN